MAMSYWARSLAVTHLLPRRPTARQTTGPWPVGPLAAERVFGGHRRVAQMWNAEGV